MKLRTLALTAAIGLTAVAATQAQDVSGRSLKLRGSNTTAANLGTVTVPALTAPRTYTFQDLDGTIALTTGTLSANRFVYTDASGLITTTGALSNGQILIGNGGGAPSAATLGVARGLTVTNGAGTISLGMPTAVTTSSVLRYNGTDWVESGTTFTVDGSGNVVAGGTAGILGDATFGAPLSTTGGSLIIHDDAAGTSFTGTISAPAFTANRTFSLPDASGTLLAGTGTANTLPLWTAGGGLTNSIVTQDAGATTATVGGAFAVTGTSDLQGAISSTTGNLTIADVTDINASANNNTNINTGTSTGAVAIGNGAAGNIGLTSAGTISTTGTTALNASANFNTNINTGTSTGAVGIGNSAAGNIGLTSAGTISTTGTTALNDNANFNTNINTGTSTGAVGIGNAAAGNIGLTSAGTISTTGTTSLNASANFNTNINTGTSTGQTTIGNTTGGAGIFALANLNAGAALTVTNASVTNSVGLDITDASLVGLKVGSSSAPTTGAQVNASTLGLFIGNATAPTTGIQVNTAVGADMTINQDAISRANADIAINPGAANKVTTDGGLQVDGNTTLGNAITDLVTINGTVRGSEDRALAAAATNKFAGRVQITFAADGAGPAYTINNTQVTANSTILITVQSNTAINYTAVVSAIAAGASFNVRIAGGLGVGDDLYINYMIINP